MLAHRCDIVTRDIVPVRWTLSLAGTEARFAKTLLTPGAPAGGVLRRNLEPKTGLQSPSLHGQTDSRAVQEAASGKKG
jgi:hypothetical protein